MSHPYIDLEVTNEYITREFNEHIDNQLPTSLNQPIFIPRHTWHRAIKSTGTLRLKIYKS
jgi:hypothetical protein